MIFSQLADSIEDADLRESVKEALGSIDEDLDDARKKANGITDH